MSASESASRSRDVREPQRYGTGTNSEGRDYTLTQAGAGASYGWSATGTRLTDRYETVDVLDGAVSTLDTRWATLASSGANDAAGGTYWLSDSGPETSTLVESGYHGPESFTESQFRTGSVSEGESGGFWDYSFARSEVRSGTYTLAGTMTETGGNSTESGTGSYSESLGGSGTDPGGSVSYSVADSEYGYAGTSTETLSGRLTTSSDERSDSDTKTTTGDEGTGAFTLAHASSADSLATAVVTHPDLTAAAITATETVAEGSSDDRTEVGALGAGSYTLTGTSTSSEGVTGSSIYLGESASWTSSDGRTVAVQGSGDRLAGSFTLSETATTSGGSSGTDGRSASQTGGGVTGSHTLGDSDSGNQSGTATDDRTGSLASGSYTLHETSTSTTTATDGSLDDTDAAGTAGSTSGDDAGATDRQTATTTATLDRSGNSISGTYTLHQTGSTGGSETDTSTEDTGWAPGDGEDDETDETDAGTETQSGGWTLDRTGSAVSGSYSEHYVSNSTATLYGTATDSATDDAADGSVDDDTDVNKTTTYRTGSSTIDRTGNEVAGDYSLHEVDASTDTVYGTATDHQTGDEADGEYDLSDYTDGSTAYQTGTVTTDATGNGVSGGYSRHVVASNSGSAFDTGTDTATDDLADGSVDDDVDVESDRDYQASGSTTDRTGNSVTGDYSLHAVSTSSGADYATGTDTPTDAIAGGEHVGRLLTSLGTYFQSGTVTTDSTGNEVGGSYSEHVVSSRTGTDKD
jgi:hypothetical protein